MLTLKGKVREHLATPKRPKASRLSVISAVPAASRCRAKPAINLLLERACRFEGATIHLAV